MPMEKKKSISAKKASLRFSSFLPFVQSDPNIHMLCCLRGSQLLDKKRLRSTNLERVLSGFKKTLKCETRNIGLLT